MYVGVIPTIIACLSCFDLVFPMYVGVIPVVRAFNYHR